MSRSLLYVNGKLNLETQHFSKRGSKHFNRLYSFVCIYVHACALQTLPVDQVCLCFYIWFCELMLCVDVCHSALWTLLVVSVYTPWTDIVGISGIDVIIQCCLCQFHRREKYENKDKYLSHTLFCLTERKQERCVFKTAAQVNLKPDLYVYNVSMSVYDLMV